MFQKLTISLCIILGSSFGITAQTAPIKKTVIKPHVAVKVQGNKTTVKEGESLLLSATGESDIEMLQWQISNDGVQWKDVPQANGNNFEVDALTASTFYRVITKPVEGSLAVEVPSKPVFLAIEENVASMGKKKH